MSIQIPGIKDTLTIQNLHRIINRCDVVKDASISPPSTSVTNKGPGSVFGTAADALFGIKINGKQFDGSKTILDSIKKAVLDGKFQGGALGGDPESIVSIKMSKALKDRLKRDLRAGDSEAGNLVEKSLPETYQFAFHDSGDTPGLIQAGIDQILTPGSYIDPAGRVKEGIRAPKAGTTNLTEYGFDGLTLNWNWLPDDKCQLTISMGDINHTEIRNREHNHDGPPPDYFGGNDKKNAWFNSPTGNQIAVDAKKYILCKELGDTTQATFAKYLFDQPGGSGYTASNSCLFTLDTVLAVRCKLLEVPCCAKDYGKGDASSEEKYRRLLFFRPIGDPAEITRTRNILAINETIKHNNASKFAIANILNEGFYIGTELLNRNSINNYIQDYLYSIQDTIDYANEILTKMINNTDMVARPEEEIRQIVAYLRANDLFKVKRKGTVVSYQLIATVRNLFLSDSSEIYNTNITRNLAVRQNRSANVFQGSIMGPSLDVIANFRDKIVAKGGKTIHDHISFLKSPPKDITDRIQAAISPSPVVGGWQIKGRRINTVSTKSVPKSVPKSAPKSTKKGGSMEIDKFKQQYGYMETRGKTTYFDFDYDPDTLDLLWLLFKNLRTDSKIMRAYYTSNMVDENRTNYMEDFAFFMYPYFRYLGEACFDIKGLQWFHDTYYVMDDAPMFENVIRGYVARIMIPRSSQMNENDILASNQDKFLKKFKTASISYMSPTKSTKMDIEDSVPELVRTPSPVSKPKSTPFKYIFNLAAHRPSTGVTPNTSNASTSNNVSALFNIGKRSSTAKKHKKSARTTKKRSAKLLSAFQAKRRRSMTGIPTS